MTREEALMDFRKMTPLRKGLTRYGVFEHCLASASKLGEVRKVEVDKNPWSDRQPVIKWAAFKPDGERVAVCATRQEAASALATGRARTAYAAR